MLNKFLNNTLNKSSRALSEAKAKVEETAKKKVNDILGNNIPTPQDLETKLRNKLNNPTPEQLLEAERIYNRTLNLINSAIFRLEAKKSELQSIKTKLEGISGNLQGFRDFVDFLDPALKAFRAAIPGINGALAGSSGPAASGKLISDLTLKKKDIKESLKKANDAIESFKSPADYFTKESNKILSPIDKSIAKIQELINYLLSIKAQILAIYVSFLVEIDLLTIDDPLAEEGDEDSEGSGDPEGSGDSGDIPDTSSDVEGGNINEDDITNNPDLLNDIISNSMSSNRFKPYIIRNANGEVVRYGVGNPPTNEITSDESGRG